MGEKSKWRSTAEGSDDYRVVGDKANREAETRLGMFSWSKEC